MSCCVRVQNENTHQAFTMKRQNSSNTKSRYLEAALIDKKKIRQISIIQSINKIELEIVVNTNENI